MRKKMFSFVKTKSMFTRFSLIGLFAIIAYALILTACNGSSNKKETRLIVGWQTAWATAGQIVETMVNTNIPELYKSNATFRNFLFGPDMLEASLGGNIDATTTGVVPAINLLAASDDWVIVCRLIDFSCVTIARNVTNIKSYADLKGHKLGVPFGSGAHPYIVQRLKENNLTIGTGPDAVELINVSPAEAIVVLQQGGVDAIGAWEPNATIMEQKEIGKAIDEKRYIGFLSVRKSIVENNPEEVVALIKSLIEANLYVAKNREQTDEWFAKRSNFERELLKKIRVIEPNLKANRIEDISVEISQEDIVLSQQVADQMFESGLIKRKINLNDRINLKLAQKAISEISVAGSKESNIKVLK